MSVWYQKLSNGIKSKTFWLLACILVWGTFLRFWGLNWGLPYEYQSEEYKVVKYALKMGGGDLNPHFFEYPSLYLYFTLFLYGLYFVFGKTVGLFKTTHDFALLFVKDPTNFYLIARISEAVCGVLIILLVYKIGKKLFSEKVGLCSALIFSALPHFVYSSHMVKAVMGMIVLLLLFFLMILRIIETGDKKSYILAGIFLGLAISTKYPAAPFGILLPVAHFMSQKKNSWKILVLSLVLIPIFFFLGTPYSLLSFQEFWKDFRGYSSIYASLSVHDQSYAGRMLIALSRFIILGDYPAPPFLGIVCATGFFISLARWKKEHLLAVIPIVVYLIIVGSYHNPAGGYLLQVFPLFVIWGVHGLLTLFENDATSSIKKFLKWVALSALTVAVGWNLWDGTRWAYSFTVKDTRTMAKEWIDQNIPPESKILIDVKVLSPSLQMSYAQLEKFYLKAVGLNHYKKEYLKFQLEVHPGKNAGYDIYTIKRSFRQIGSLEHQVEEVQKLQDLVEVNQDIQQLKKMGIQYVITNDMVSESSIKNQDPGLSDFYRALPSQATLLKVFNPLFSIYHCGTIRIYQL